jgi:hypothetical protein
MSATGRLARRLILAEFRSYRALAGWLVRRPDVPARPHVVDSAGIRVRSGTSAEVAVPWDAVAAVAVRPRMREKSRGIQLDRGGAGAVLNMVAGSQTNVDLALRRPLDLALPDRTETVSAVRLYCDDPRAFVAAARERLAAIATRPRTAT